MGTAVEERETKQAQSTNLCLCVPGGGREHVRAVTKACACLGAPVEETLVKALLRFIKAVLRLYY